MVTAMIRVRSVIRVLSAGLLLPLLGGAGDGELPAVPISIDITTQLDFSRAAVSDKVGGNIRVDAQSGLRSVDGGLVDLGGFGLAGSAVVRGEPGRGVRIDMPPSIKMTSSTGGQIDISDLRTNLSPAPRLDSFGQLNFAFGGKLQVHGNVSGTFRGRIPINAEYE
jgi:hypothetical protein